MKTEREVLRGLLERALRRADLAEEELEGSDKPAVKAALSHIGDVREKLGMAVARLREPAA